MMHLGDITKINGAEIPIVDCICGGSPCQDLSVAGKRAGLDGERSGLFMDQIRVVKEMREHDRSANQRTGQFVRPRFMVWENVPGALSSNKGEDFRCVLEETARIAQKDAVIPGPPKSGWSYAGGIVGDGWSIAWRIHDAQFWGVPQRRKRIALVADFGGGSAPEILFVRKGLSGDSEESGEERKGVASNVKGGVAATITSAYGRNFNGNAGAYNGENFVFERAISFQERAGKPGGGKGILIQDERTGALSTLNNQNVFCLQGGGTTSQNSQGSGVNENVSFTINALDVHGVAYRSKVEPTMIEMTSTKNTVVEDGISPTLTARMGTGGNQVNAVCMDVGFFQTYEDVAGTLLARQHKDPPITYQDKCGSLMASGYQKNGTQEAANDMYVVNNVVRRLTPLECERLQGFPDGWTEIGEWTDSKGKMRKCSDSARYKALGNSIAIPFWFYLLRRISAQYERPATLGSLFDGIGGFPLCWERCNGPGTAIWASEIEEFPIAVTKRHFPEKEETT